jgi:hypothetical protein
VKKQNEERVREGEELREREKLMIEKVKNVLRLQRERVSSERKRDSEER